MPSGLVFWTQYMYRPTLWFKNGTPVTSYIETYCIASAIHQSINQSRGSESVMGARDFASSAQSLSRQFCLSVGHKRDLCQSLNGLSWLILIKQFCLSVCLSVTFRYCIETAEHITVLYPIILHRVSKKLCIFLSVRISSNFRQL